MNVSSLRTARNTNEWSQLEFGQIKQVFLGEVLHSLNVNDRTHKGKVKKSNEIKLRCQIFLKVNRLKIFLVPSPQCFESGACWCLLWVKI